MIYYEGDNALKKRIIVYGLGRVFARVHARILQLYEVAAYTDKGDPPPTVAKKFISPRDIPYYAFDKILICSTRYYGDIKKSLLPIGIDESQIYGLWGLVSEEEEAGDIIAAWKRAGRLTPKNGHYKEQIFVIGDSHTCFLGGNNVKEAKPLGKWLNIRECSNVIHPFQVFHTGPGLAYNACRYGTFAATREKVDFLLKYGFIPKNSTILCCFGEIDIRVHAIRQAEQQGISVEKVLDCIIERYLAFLQGIQKTNHVMVWGPIPSTKDGAYRDPLWPYYGSERARNIATAYFNQRLEETCESEKIGYVSVFKYLIDENYMTKGEYLYDGYHLAQKAWKFAMREFKSKGILVKVP